MCSPFHTSVYSLKDPQMVGGPEKAGRGKREISEGIWDLDPAGTEKAEPGFAANLDTLL